VSLSEQSGSVRIDLVGGTLDLEPINVILPNVVTINAALSLQASVKITPVHGNKVEIFSKDYNSKFFFNGDDFTLENLASDHFGPMRLVAEIIHQVGLTSGIRIELESGAPAGSGLGGSSTMGVTLFKALLDYKGEDADPLHIIKQVRNLEAKILDRGPAGYQDYYPAMFGGLLALKATPSEITLEQHYDEAFVKELCSHMTLVYSGLSRNSGINNWEVYKGFFDNIQMRAGLTKIAEISHAAYVALVNKDVESLVKLIALEGTARSMLFSDILPEEIKRSFSELSEKINPIGIKACGAGGGGCFLVLHAPEDSQSVKDFYESTSMSVLPLEVIPK
jgi:D-glycero-alpha-D-manno-heptose-7-phosphate kinase